MVAEHRLVVGLDAPRRARLELPHVLGDANPPAPIPVTIPVDSDDDLGAEVIKVTSVISGVAILRDSNGTAIGRVSLDQGVNQVRIERKLDV